MTSEHPAFASAIVKNQICGTESRKLRLWQEALPAAHVHPPTRAAGAFPDIGVE